MLGDYGIVDRLGSGLEGVLIAFGDDVRSYAHVAHGLGLGLEGGFGRLVPSVYGDQIVEVRAVYDIINTDVPREVLAMEFPPVSVDL